MKKLIRYSSLIILIVFPSAGGTFHKVPPAGQEPDAYSPDFRSPPAMSGMKLVWNDEFNIDGRPDSLSWIYERGFVRNMELQWYQRENATCRNGVLIIEGRKEKVRNPYYKAESGDWRLSREYGEFTSASIQTKGLKQWKFGRFEIRARIDTSAGAWPAIWTLGVTHEWPSNGEIDIMEFYRIKGVPSILANFAWGTDKRYMARWKDLKKPLSDFTVNDPDWTKKFHVWRMDWTSDSISLFLDDRMLNSVSLSLTVNPDGFNPFLQEHFLLLNLALGGNGADPSHSCFPIRYELDYVRIYQQSP
jgi:beta-glucanase (GH16 family)